MVEYAGAGDLLEADGRAWADLDGDGWGALFFEDGEDHEDPFGTPLVGHNALRAYLLDAAASQRDVEFTVERHWVSGDTVLASWHVSFVSRASGETARKAGFLTAEVASDGGIARFREWWMVPSPRPA